MTLKDVKSKKDLIAEGAPEGTVPTELNQATGMERLEILGKMEGIDVFDMKPLDASRRGTMKDPIMVDSLDPVRYIGCTGFPAQSHEVIWLELQKDHIARCPESGQCYKMNYLGPPLDGSHGHAGHH